MAWLSENLKLSDENEGDRQTIIDKLILHMRGGIGARGDRPAATERDIENAFGAYRRRPARRRAACRRAARGAWLTVINPVIENRAAAKAQPACNIYLEKAHASVNKRNLCDAVARPCNRAAETARRIPQELCVAKYLCIGDGALRGTATMPPYGVR